MPRCRRKRSAARNLWRVVRHGLGAGPAARYAPVREASPGAVPILMVQDRLDPRSRFWLRGVADGLPLTSLAPLIAVMIDSLHFFLDGMGSAAQARLKNATDVRARRRWGGNSAIRGWQAASR